MRILVTGGCGFIGTNLNASLIGGGHRVRVLDDLSVGSRAALAETGPVAECSADEAVWREHATELVVGDVLDGELCRRLAAGTDAIVHLAANTGVAPSIEDPHYDCRVNVVGTLNLLEAARHEGVERFVMASSGATVGECTPPIHEELPPHPVSPYGASKLAGEAYCSAYYRTFGIKTVALRFGNVYGPRSGTKQSVVARFIRRAMAGEELQVYGDGRQTRDFIFIGDLLRAILAATEASGVGGEVFQIATARETSVLELLEVLLPVLEETGAADGVRVAHTEARLGDVRRNYSDTSKAERLLSWQARVSLEEGLRQTVAWFQRPRPAAAGDA